MMPLCLRRWLHRAALLWREDASPKKSHPNGGEEAMLVETIPPGRSRLLFCLFFLGVTAVVGKAFWLQCGIDTEFLQKQGRRDISPARSISANRRRTRYCVQTSEQALTQSTTTDTPPIKRMSGSDRRLSENLTARLQRSHPTRDPCARPPASRRS